MSTDDISVQAPDIDLQVQKLPTNTVKAQLLSEERFAGVVSTELGSGQWRSEVSSLLLNNKSIPAESL